TVWLIATRSALTASLSRSTSRTRIRTGRTAASAQPKCSPPCPMTNVRSSSRPTPGACSTSRGRSSRSSLTHSRIGGTMRVYVDPERCRGHARCLTFAPNAFEYLDLEDRVVASDGEIAPEDED